MQWSSRRTNSIIAATICGIFGIVVLFFVRVITIESYKKDITLNDIFPTRDIVQDEPNSYVAPHTSRQEPAMPKTTLIDSSETNGNVKVLVYYYIIVESFRNITQAQRRAEELINDFNLNIILLPHTSEGYYRISCGRYSTLEEAKSSIKSIRTDIRSDAWILSAKE